MKKLFSITLLFLGVFLLSATVAQAGDVLYAEIDGDNMILKCGDSAPEESYVYDGTTSGINKTYYDENGNKITSSHRHVTTVTIDPSCQSYSGNTLAYLFVDFNSLQTINGLSNLNTVSATSMDGMFMSCSSLTSIDLSSFNTTNVTSMSGMFLACSKLTSLNLSGWNTANVTNMSMLFRGCSKMSSLNLSGWNTACVTNMSSMFNGCSSLTNLDISNFNTSNVTNMVNMFIFCSSLTSLDLCSFNTANVTQMSNLFESCSSLKTIYVDDEKWSTANVFYGGGIFNNCTVLVGGKGTQYDSRYTSKDYAHVDGGADNPGYFTAKGQSAPDPVKVKEPYAVLSDDNTTLTFYYDGNKSSRNGMSVGPFTLELESDRVNSGWYDQCTSITSVVFDNSFADYNDLTSTAYWFANCTNMSSINGIENLKTGNVGSMRNMFINCSSLKSLDLSSFNTKNVTDMWGMFVNCSNLTSLDVRNFITDNVKTMGYMFEGCSSLVTLDIKNFKTGNVTDMYSMFSHCSSLTSLDVSNFNTANVTNMSAMLNYCKNITSFDVSKFNTDNVTNMSRMFSGCTSLTSLDVSHFNTANVTNMEGMFSFCSSLTSLDVSNFRTENVTEMSRMFRDCVGLAVIYSNDSWKCNLSDDMFNNCKSLTGAISYDSEKTDITYANPTTGYFTYKRLTPMEDQEEVNFGENDNLNEDTNLGGTVIDNVYYNISPENGGYDANDNCVVVSKAMTDGEIETVFGKDLLSDEVKNTFAGIVIEVAGKGNITIEAQTTGGMTLKVKIGPAEPVEMELEGKLKMKFPFNVTEPTYVYIYAGEASAAGSRKSGSRGNESPSLKIYGISVSTDSYLKGDANGDGVISDADVIAVKDYIMGNEPENFVFEGADANEDGKVNVADIVEIVNKKK